MQEFTHVIADPSGLHARPVGQLVQLAAKFSSTVTISAPSGTADARRLLAVMHLAARQGHSLTVTVEGADELPAAEALKAFFRDHL